MPFRYYRYLGLITELEKCFVQTLLDTADRYHHHVFDQAVIKFGNQVDFIN